MWRFWTGGWNRIEPGEDPDEARRLYYVAMTRARQTVTLARMQGPHRLQEALIGHRSVVQREPVDLPPSSPALKYRHIRVGLQDVDLGFAGRQDPRRPVHRAIAALSPGDPLEARPGAGGTWALLDPAGTVVGRLARSFKPPMGTRCRAAEVFAVVEWSREASDPIYRDTVRSERWEVVVPELVFEPDVRGNRPVALAG